MKKYIILLLVFVFKISYVWAQCPMCRSAVESSMKSGQNKAVGMGLNTGILMLLATVYIVAFAIAGIWFYHYKKAKKQQLNFPS
jgi:hypothetical protein